MYNIVKDGAVLALTERPNYVRRQENGYFAICEAQDAQGIVHNGTVYHLAGREALEGQETVVLEQVDGGTEMENTKLAVADADAMNVDQELRLTMLELGIDAASLEL